MGLTGTHVALDMGRISDDNLRDAGINANTAALAAIAAAKPTPASTAVGVATSTTVETVMLAALIPANTVAVGSAYRVVMFGVTAGSGNPTFKVHLGAAGTTADALAATIGAITHTVAASGRVEFLVTFRAIGAGGNAMVNGTAVMGVVATAQSAAAPAVAAVATNAPFYITVTATMSASTFTAHNVVVNPVA